MTWRTLLILGVLAAGASLAVWLTQDDPDADIADTGMRFQPGLLEELDAVDGATVRGAGGRIVAELDRSDSGTWRVRNRWDYPANSGALRETLIALAEARRRDARTDDPERWHRLGVEAIDEPDAAGMEIEIHQPGGEHDGLRVVVGRTASAGNGTFVRAAGEDRAWLIDQRIDRRLEIGDWLRSRLVDIDLDAIVAVDIEPVEGDVVRVRPDVDDVSGFRLPDVPPGSELLTPTIGRSIARVVADLHFTDVRPRSDAEPLSAVARARYETKRGLIVYVHSYTLPDDGNAEAVRMTAAVTDPASAEVRERADGLNKEWSGWVYRLPEHKFVNASHDLDRILANPPVQQ